MARILFLLISPRTPRRIAIAAVQLVVLAIAAGTLAALMAAGQPDPIPAPIDLHELTQTERTTETTGHGGL
jgi:hypothetical protein